MGFVIIGYHEKFKSLISHATLLSRLPKKGILASRLWEEIVLALVGGQFSGVPDGEVCGAVISIRERTNVLAIWTKSGKNQQMINKVGQALRRILSLPTNAFSMMYYQTHPRPTD